MINRIGFACKYVLPNKSTKDDILLEKTFNTSSTTVKWLNERKHLPYLSEDRLWSITKHNLASVKKVLEILSAADPQLRMMRLSSDLLPMFTEPTWKYFWKKPDVISLCEHEFSQIGEYARKHDIRLSFHPGQFCVLASITPEIVTKSIEEFEYHVTMAKWMGYGNTWHDYGFKINVHISGRNGPNGIISALSRLSPEARNLITIENDEMTWGIDASLDLEKHVALVLDIHHHLLYSEGEYIQRSDDRWKRIVDSWRGIRPTIHYSLSREDVLVNHCKNTLPNWSQIRTTYTKSKLRAHSNGAWNTACNTWALSFLTDADIMVECKNKNLGAFELYLQSK